MYGATELLPSPLHYPSHPCLQLLQKRHIWSYFQRTFWTPKGELAPSSAHRTKQRCTASLSTLFTIAVWYDTHDMRQHKVTKHNLSSPCHLTTLLSGSYSRNKDVTSSSRCLDTGNLSQKIHSMFLPQVNEQLLESQMFPEQTKFSMKMVLTEKSCVLSGESPSPPSPMTLYAR